MTSVDYSPSLKTFTRNCRKNIRTENETIINNCHPKIWQPDNNFLSFLTNKTRSYFLTSASKYYILYSILFSSREYLKYVIICNVVLYVLNFTSRITYILVSGWYKNYIYFSQSLLPSIPYIDQWCFYVSVYCNFILTLQNVTTKFRLPLPCWFWLLNDLCVNIQFNFIGIRRTRKGRQRYVMTN